MKNGGKRSGAGRPKGSWNKDTEKIRTAITMIVEDNLENMQAWLSDIAKDSPKEAFNCLKDLIEYTTPKMARVEQSTRFVDEDGKDLTAKDMEILRNYEVKLLNGAKDDRIPGHILIDDRKSEDRIQ